MSIGDGRILLVDDSDDIREFSTSILQHAGYSVATASNGEEAFAQIRMDRPDLVISDVVMPRMDGLQLFARVRAIDPEIPIILITGHADVPMAIGALKDGAFDFLTKPFAADHLVAATRKALETRRLVLDNRRLRAAAEGMANFNFAEENKFILAEERTFLRKVEP